MLGDDFVVGVDDLELDVFVVDDGVDVLGGVAADFLAALGAGDVLLPTAVPDVVVAVLLGPEEEYLDGEVALAALVPRQLVTERAAAFADED